jgi:hypothetical protein
VRNPVYFAGSNPPSPQAIEKGRLFSDAIHLTMEEEHEAFAVYFSLTTFFGAAMEITACREILEEVVDKPSVWSVVRHLGVRTDFHYFWADARTVEDGRSGVPNPAYFLPVQVFLNGKCGVKATLAVTAPRPPLTTCAGILAICAEHPVMPDRRLYIRVLATSHAATSGSSADASP